MIERLSDRHGTILATLIRVPQKAKPSGKSLAATKPGGKKSACIRLDDLMPRKTVTGGARLLFGARNNSQNQTK
jgi:hypothetical protein